MRQILKVTPSELKECVALAVGRVLKEEINRGEMLNEGLMDKIKDAVKTYGYPAALGILIVALHNYGISEAEIEQIESDMREHPEEYFGNTYDNGGLDYDADHANLPEDDDLSDDDDNSYDEYNDSYDEYDDTYYYDPGLNP